MDVENIIMTFQSNNKTSKWAENLHRFQAMKNNRFHRGIGMTSFEALYGHKISSLPHAYNNTEVVTSNEEEEVEEDPAPISATLFSSSEKEADEDPIPTSVSVLSAVEVTGKELSDDENRELLDLSHAAIKTNLETARTKQRKQADNMLLSTAMRYGVVEVGTTVRIHVPEVDRSKTGPRNVLAVVMEQNNGWFCFSFYIFIGQLYKMFFIVFFLVFNFWSID
jgi:hypothetical protein